MSKSFKFYAPLNISKAKDEQGEEIMKLGGIASTIDEDADGEFLDPSGFEISDFQELGVVNWHHQSKDKPSAIIGEPCKAEIRKDGFYVETELYKSSALAREVFELAEVMERDSKKRKLGYSIEGVVIERDTENPSIVKKAKITGLAITHMPKNPKTFAQIIKGHLSKSLDTESGDALTEESVDGSVKNQEKDKEKDKKKKNKKLFKSTYSVKKLDDEKMYDLIFDEFPSISIEKAEKIFELFNQIDNKMAKGKLTDGQLKKAMDILELDDLDNNPFLEKGEKSKHPNDDLFDEGMEDVDIRDRDYNTPKETSDDSDDEDEDDMEKGCEDDNKTDTMKKSNEPNLTKGAVMIIKKAIESSEANQVNHTKALGHLVKATLDKQAELEEKIETLSKANEDTLGELGKANQKIASLSRQSRGRKSLTKSYREKESFQKGKESNGKQLSVSRNYKQVLDLVDGAAFAKGGFDEDFSKAVTHFEATKTLPTNIIQRIKSEFDIDIVQ